MTGAVRFRLLPLLHIIMISSLQEGEMATSGQDSPNHQALRLSRERPARTYSGYAMLLVLLVAFIAIPAGGAVIAGEREGAGAAILVLGILAILLVLPGFYLLQPNQAAALLLFGDYKGSD